jgi:hypothetical protein
MVYLYDACDQLSDFCHQQLLRKMRRKISWTDGRKDRRTEVKQYTPRSQFLKIKYFALCFLKFFLSNLYLISNLGHVIFVEREISLLYPPLPEGGGGYTVLPLSVCPSFRPSIVAVKNVTKNVHICSMCIKTN